MSESIQPAATLAEQPVHQGEVVSNGRREPTIVKRADAGPKGVDLYAVAGALRAIFERIDQGELDENAAQDTIEGLLPVLQERSLAVARFAGNLEALVAAMKDAEKRIAERRKAAERRIEGLKAYIKVGMEASGILKIESPDMALSIRKNPHTVEVLDESIVPHDYIRTEVVTSLDKKAILEHLKAGGEVPGTQLRQNTRLAIA